MSFLNVDILFTMAGANPNRDDVGAPKTIQYGGVTRSRISSQAMTRPKRLAYEMSSGDLTLRSRVLGQKLYDLTLALLAKQGVTLSEEDLASILTKSKKAVKELASKEDKEASKKESDGEEGASKETATWLAESELQDQAEKIAVNFTSGADFGFGVSIDGNKTDALSIAAFGRMFAARPDLQTEAAVQRSHAISTHAVEIEADYFTAVSDLSSEGQAAGSDHLGMHEMVSSTYHWHFNIDVEELKKNWLGWGEENAADRLRELFKALLVALPEGKSNTMAARGLPDLVVATHASQPTTLVQAFESPIKSTEGNLKPSVEAALAELDATVDFMPSAFFGKKIAAKRRVNEDSCDLDSLIEWLVAKVLA